MIAWNNRHPSLTHQSFCLTLVTYTSTCFVSLDAAFYSVYGRLAANACTYCNVQRLTDTNPMPWLLRLCTCKTTVTLILDVTMLVDAHAQQLYSELDSTIVHRCYQGQWCYQALSRVAVHVHQQALLHLKPVDCCSQM